MSFPIALSDLNDAARVVYILDLNLGTEELEAGGGNVYRLATEPVTIDAGDGGEIAYLGGVMDLPDVVDEYGRSQINDEGPSIPIEVFIDGVDIAALWAKGKRFARARGELSAVTVGVDGQVQQTWPNRLKQALGRVELPRFGDPEADPGWLSFTLRSLPYNDVSVVNLPTAVVDEDTWAGAGSDVLGKTYPLPVGKPGPYVRPDDTNRNTSGSPAYVVADTGGDADTLLIAGDVTEAGLTEATVRIFDEGGLGEDFAASVSNDGRGQPVTTVDVSSAGVIDRADSQFYVSWTGGGGVLSPLTDGRLEGLGDVILWLLLKSSLPVDLPKWDVNRALLNRLKVGYHFNDPTKTPYETVLELLEDLPWVSIYRGPDGLYPIVRRPELSDEDAVLKVTVGPDFYPQGPLEVQTEQNETVNVVTVRFVQRVKTGVYQRYVTCTPDPDPSNTNEFATEYAVVSASRYGVTAAETIEVPWIYDLASAQQLAAETVRYKGFGEAWRTYRTNHLFGRLEVGQVILLTDATLSITDQFVEVVGKRPILGGWVLRLAFDDDPIRNAVKRLTS